MALDTYKIIHPNDAAQIIKEYQADHSPKKNEEISLAPELDDGKTYIVVSVEDGADIGEFFVRVKPRPQMPKMRRRVY